MFPGNCSETSLPNVKEAMYCLISSYRPLFGGEHVRMVQSFLILTIATADFYVLAVFAVQ